MILEIKRTLVALRRRFAIDHGDYRNTVFLAGTGRSGTTWVEDIINGDNQYRVMFEPFHAQKVGILKEWNYRQYLRIDNSEEKFLKPAETILSGRIKHEWIDRHNRRFISSKRLVKDIRAQLFLKWMKHHFSEIPIILLLRHPCAVAASKLKLEWGSPLEDFLSQPELMQDFLEPFRSVIESATEDFERHILVWCIENCVPLKQFQRGEILVMFYEEICTDPEKEIERLTSFLGASSKEGALKAINRPSLLSRKDSAIHSGGDLINSWRKNISEDQINRMVELLDGFGLSAIYGRESMPLVSGDEALDVFN